MSTIRCSLLISTYNWPQALSLCLQSIALQTQMPDEVIICDDGSKAETAQLIQSFQEQFPIAIKHVWQPDEGFQLARIRNKGFAEATGDYCIQIDGDLILHPYFVEDHMRFAKQGYFTTGSRVLLPDAFTKNLFEQNNCRLFTGRVPGKNKMNGLRIPLLQPLFGLFYKRFGKHKYYVKGCNMAFWKSDLIRVNGYNEDFTGWGREDSELAIRLMNSGIKKRFLKFGAICYHLYHREASREMEQVNIDRMNQAIIQKTVTSPLGLNQYTH
jgi:glycosyltransferase involved in cell wall biosynthesis